MKIVIFVLCTIFLCSFVQAEDVFDVAEKYNKEKKKMFSIEGEKRKILSQIYSSEREIKKIVEEKAEITHEKIILDKKMKKVSKDVVRIEEELGSIAPALKKRWAYLNKIKSVPWVYALLSSDSISDLEKTFRAFSNINKKETTMIVEYFSKIESLKFEKIKLQNLAKQTLKARNKIFDQENMIKRQNKNKKQMLGKLNLNIKRTRGKLLKIKTRGLRLTEGAGTEDLNLLFGTDFFDKKGKLPHPVQSMISHGYGLNMNLLGGGVELMHKGVFYKAKIGEKVKSIARGRIEHIGQLPGFGKSIIVSHGGSYYSVYSALKKVNVKLKQVIKKSEILAEVGDPHPHFGQGLYFELRHFSVAENPQKWLIPKKIENKIVSYNKQRRF